MEIKLNLGDKFKIPAGCKATIKDNQIVIEQEEEFKDGDILISNQKRVLIFSNYRGDYKSIFDSYFDSINDQNSGWFTRSFRLATDEEKQEFFDTLKTKGLRWNPETKQMEKIRNRVTPGSKYLCINGLGEIIDIFDCEDFIDNTRYNLGNYYLLKERKQAEKDAAEIRAIFERRVKVQVQV